MKRMLSLTVLNLLLFVILMGCSQETAQTDKMEEPAVEESEPQLAVVEKPVTIRDTIEVMINEAVQRVRYGDKSMLYDMEFEYYTRDLTYDDYLKKREIMFARADSVTFLEITNFKLFEHDSAEVILNVHFEGPTGIHHALPDTITVYYYDNRWIKPTASTIQKQLEYEQSK